MKLEKVKEVFNSLYTDIDGRALSLEGRESNQYKSKSFVYGEVLPESFFQMVSFVNPKPGQIFYDLGSGTGKPTMLAAMLFEFEKSIGVEFVEGLYNASMKAKTRFEKEIQPKLKDDEKVKTKIEFIYGNFLDIDVDDADVIWLPCTCYQDDLMLALDQKLQTLKPGTHIISLSKTLKSPCYQVYKSQLYDFSWGQATAFYHKKL